MKYLIKERLSHDGKEYAPNDFEPSRNDREYKYLSEIELDEKTAQPLLDAGVIEIQEVEDITKLYKNELIALAESKNIELTGKETKDELVSLIEGV